MKRIVTFIALMLALCLAGCGTVPARPQEQTSRPAAAQSTEPEESSAAEESETETQRMKMIRLTIGKSVIMAQLADSPAARELEALLREGPVTMSASNYGGFEKVCELGTRLTSDDVRTTTRPGDVMLYSGDRIVIFYGSNTWAYTRLAHVVEEDVPKLREALSGSENEVIIELADN